MAFYDNLLKHDYKVDFLLVTGKNRELEPYVRERGSDVYKVPAGKKFDQKRIQYINEVLRNGNYDIVHVNFPGPNGAMVLKIAKKNGVKIRIYHCHNPLNKLSIKSIVSESIFTPLCRKYANRYLACSNQAGVSIFKEKKFDVINNAIDPTLFVYDDEKREQIRKQINLDNQLVIGVAARMEDQKNPSFVVEVFHEIKKIRKDAILLWVGDGSRLNQIKTMSEEMGIQDSVLLVGRQSNVADWYSAMDILLLPSKFEGLGIVYLEAQANGLLCFGSDNVPEETQVTTLMHRISLNKAAEKWAVDILKEYDSIQEKHKVDIDLFKEKGFDVRYIGDRLSELYQSYCSE